MTISQTTPVPVARIDLADIAGLIARMRQGERRAISAVITELERHSAAAPEILKALQPHLGHALVAGFTGPPGAGKSTLVNAVIEHLRKQGRTVGVWVVSAPASALCQQAEALPDSVIQLTDLPDDVGAVYEVVIDGVDEATVAQAMRVGIRAACRPGVVRVTAGNYGGKLGPFHFHLHQLLAH